MATHSNILAWKIPKVWQPAVHGIAESDLTEYAHVEGSSITRGDEKLLLE